MRDLAALKFDPRQNTEEIDWLTWRMSGARRVLEIGSRYGGSLYRIAQSLPKGALLVSVDKPADEAGQTSLTVCARTIREEFGHDVRVIFGNSRKQKIVTEVSAFAPFDLVFIDGDHSIEGVTSDWINYGRLGKYIAFHDVGWHPRDDGNWKNIDVPFLWQVLKRRFAATHDEKIADGSRKGIGLIWGHHA